MPFTQSQTNSFLHSKGDDGYNKAIEALIRDYGSATILYPHHMRELVTDETYTYSRDGIRQFRERYLLNYQAIKELKGDTLTQFLAAHAYSNFDSKLKEEWTKHNATKTTLATLEDMIEYFGPLEHSMAQIEYTPMTFSQKPKTSQPDNKPKKPSTSIKTNTTPSSRGQCPLCKEQHSLARCSVFSSYNLEQ